MRIHGRERGADDVESAIPKLDSSSSPRLAAGAKDCRNAASSCIASASGTTRLVSLDVFRGLTVVLMILVDNAGGFFPSINHSPWNGLTLADFVMPFFLFMVGVSLGLAYKNLTCRGAASKKSNDQSPKAFMPGCFSPRWLFSWY
ncbi:hypothetical protein Fot_04730 [Forsythia ovata]|uniref:Heparan-alpha-glucosaminide N-acetyltransferase catalytic domain-containing protein n=1 Tax=Forsythia ovata TaxID=205694 RepID=A0ABD1XDE1_9LAMI